MKPVITPAEMAEADRRAIASGTREAVLVERAGAAVARHTLRMLGGVYARRVVVVRGKGNNGADGIVAARRLRALGVGVDEFAVFDDLHESRLRRALRSADLAIDAMFGTGFRGALDGDAALVANVLRDVPTLAVDIPSGVDGTTGVARGIAVQATDTVCFAAWKPGLLFEPGRSFAGRVHVVDIGIDPGATALHVIERSDLRLPTRTSRDHKWTTGALIVGGSQGMIGAPLMASRAAARSGAAMVVCALPGGDAAARASGAETVTRPLPATSEGALAGDAAADVLKDVDRFHVVAIGPGLGRDEGTQAAVRKIVAACPVPIVVDADALNALAVDLTPLAHRHAVGLPLAILTPHAGEYARLAGAPVGDDRVTCARELARRTHAIVLLKGPGTVIAAPDGTAVINRADSAALATAGTGDVLTGIIAGVAANGADPFTAAATGAYVHGCAALQAGTGVDLVATDLIAALPSTLAALRSQRDFLEP